MIIMPIFVLFAAISKVLKQNVVPSLRTYTLHAKPIVGNKTFTLPDIETTFRYAYGHLAVNLYIKVIFQNLVVITGGV